MTLRGKMEAVETNPEQVSAFPVLNNKCLLPAFPVTGAGLGAGDDGRRHFGAFI